MNEEIRALYDQIQTDNAHKNGKLDRFPQSFSFTADSPKFSRNQHIPDGEPKVVILL